MARQWITSDQHFGHDNIRIYENRPFKDLDTMNYYMIERWNSVVKARDKVWHLGDLVFGNKEYARDIIKCLNGDIHLILGNHDRSRTDAWWYSVGIKAVYRYPIIVDKWFTLSHEPLYVNRSMPYMNFHGHTHSLCYDNSHYFNCCVENWGYVPQDFEQLLMLVKEEYSC